MHDKGTFAAFYTICDMIVNAEIKCSRIKEGLQELNSKGFISKVFSLKSITQHFQQWI